MSKGYLPLPADSEITKKDTPSETSTTSCDPPAPYMKIKILQKLYPAFLDTGASDSFISTQLAADLRAEGIRVKEILYTVNMVRGTTEVTGVVTVNMAWASGNQQQLFTWYLV